MLFHFFKKKKESTAFQKKELSIDDLKKFIKVLIIDDKKNDLDKTLNAHGWTTTYVKDLKTLNDQELINANIICVDINGVGSKLGFTEEGMGLAKAIKNEYPEKKIILYSSQREHDIFSETIDFIDKRLYKSGESYPFIQAIQELAEEIYDWDKCIEYIFFRYKQNFLKTVTYESFKESIEKSVFQNKISVESVESILGITGNLSIIIVNVLNFCLHVWPELGA